VTVDDRGKVIGRQTYFAQQFSESLGDGLYLDLIAIPAGSFKMGSLPHHGYDDEHPQHLVRLAPFYLGKTVITQQQWRAVMGKLPPCRTPGYLKPVDRINWHDAKAFCRRLSELTGRPYRLPCEAQWEYACRAGTNKAFHFGPTITTDLANYVGEHTFLNEPKGVYRHDSCDVGSLPPNPFGLQEMHGNVWEWCDDTWHDDYNGAPLDGSAWLGGDVTTRLLRGGCWHDTPNLLRSASRLKYAAREAEDYFGFRVALSSLEPTQSRHSHTILRSFINRLFTSLGWREHQSARDLMEQTKQTDLDREV
jgi:formylglycine-generating enzyme required for sulfatase activity